MFNVIQAALSRCHKVSLSVLKPKDCMYNCLVWVVVMFSFRETFFSKRQVSHTACGLRDPHFFSHFFFNFGFMVFAHVILHLVCLNLLYCYFRLRRYKPKSALDFMHPLVAISDKPVVI